MATEAQINANRANAQQSTGPISAERKAASCRNNTRWGFRGQFAVLSSESQEEFDTLLESLRADHQPESVAEDLVVLKMAQHFWLSQRAQKLCDLTLETETTNPEKLFPLWLRYQVTNDRGFHKCLDQLLRIRSQRTKEAIGFERQKERSRAREQAETRAEARAEALQARESQRAERAQQRAEAHRNREEERVQLHTLAVGLAEARLTHQNFLNWKLIRGLDRLEQTENTAKAA
jgi:hypothetical protein